MTQGLIQTWDLHVKLQTHLHNEVLVWRASHSQLEGLCPSVPLVSLHSDVGKCLLPYTAAALTHWSHRAWLRHNFAPSYAQYHTPPGAFQKQSVLLLQHRASLYLERKPGSGAVMEAGVSYKILWFSNSKIQPLVVHGDKYPLTCWRLVSCQRLLCNVDVVMWLWSEVWTGSFILKIDRMLCAVPVSDFLALKCTAVSHDQLWWLRWSWNAIKCCNRRVIPPDTDPMLSLSLSSYLASSWRHLDSWENMETILSSIIYLD